MTNYATAQSFSDMVANINNNIPEPINVDECDIPAIINATYTVDLNILRIHESIKYKYAALRGSIPKLSFQILNLKKQIKSRSISQIDKIVLSGKITELQNLIYDYSNGISWLEYINQAIPIFDKYIPLASDEVKGIVNIYLRPEDVVVEDNSIIFQRLNVIYEYIEIAKKYLKLNVLCQNVFKLSCGICGEEYDQNNIDESCSTYYCTCGGSREILSRQTNYKDSCRINSGGRNDYNDCDTFVSALNRFQGIYSGKIPDSLYEKLDEYFMLKQANVGSYYRELPLDEFGKKDGTSVNMLKLALGDIKCSEYYNLINLIGHHYWGWSLPDLSKIKDKIIEAYNLTQEVYEIYKTRESSLNVNMRIYWHLKAEDYPCRAEDFCFLSSRDSLEYHQTMWKIMCDKTGVKFTNII